jgi:hypothetical protein
MNHRRNTENKFPVDEGILCDTVTVWAAVLIAGYSEVFCTSTVNNQGNKERNLSADKTQKTKRTTKYAVAIMEAKFRINVFFQVFNKVGTKCADFRDFILKNQNVFPSCRQYLAPTSPLRLYSMLTC